MHDTSQSSENAAISIIYHTNNNQIQFQQCSRSQSPEILKEYEQNIIFQIQKEYSLYTKEKIVQQTLTYTGRHREFYSDESYSEIPEIEFKKIKPLIRDQRYQNEQLIDLQNVDNLQIDISADWQNQEILEIIQSIQTAVKPITNQYFEQLVLLVGNNKTKDQCQHKFYEIYQHIRNCSNWNIKDIRIIVKTATFFTDSNIISRVDASTMFKTQDEIVQILSLLNITFNLNGKRVKYIKQE
ncbi:Hypothetical_protein [Hexamita inflata]|uniref:Hypothetical_protein n=1 Tax=Hexamita inflata TaxID=28002 RepID=A0AA86U8B7_9EUKA|nr:Hypothetical protein HINF_LOCUS29192 [Hexamita inflata]